MKIGDIIINPYVEKEYKGKPNPMYKQMVIGVSSGYVSCLTYQGKIVKYYLRDTDSFKVCRNINIKAIILNTYKINEQNEQKMFQMASIVKCKDCVHWMECEPEAGVRYGACCNDSLICGEIIDGDWYCGDGELKNK